MNMPAINVNWENIHEALEEIKERQEEGRIPFTCFYRRKGHLVGSYFCGDDEEGEFVLFLNKNYSNPTLLVNLISHHCQVLNNTVQVYALDRAAVELYQRVVNPRESICVDF